MSTNRAFWVSIVGFTSLWLLALLLLDSKAAYADDPPAWVEPVCEDPPDVPEPVDLTEGRLKFCTAWQDALGRAIPENATCDLTVSVKGEVQTTIPAQPPGKSFDVSISSHWPGPVTIDCANSAGIVRLEFDATFPETVWGFPHLLAP